MAIGVRKQCWNHGSTNTTHSGWHALSQTLQFCKSLANCTSDIKNCLSSSGVTSSLRSWKFSSSHHYPYTLNIHYIGQSRGLHHSPNVTFLINVLCSLNCTLLLKDRGQTSSFSKWNVVNQAWALGTCGHRRVHRSWTWKKLFKFSAMFSTGWRLCADLEGEDRWITWNFKQTY